jgi:uncharacterized protein YlbG (UPF0298 family)
LTTSVGVWPTASHPKSKAQTTSAFCRDTEGDFMTERTSIIVHFRSPKAIKQIEQHANVTYYHKQRKYAVCYVNATDADATMEKLKSLKLVKYVEPSLFETDDYQIDFEVSSKNT